MPVLIPRHAVEFARVAYAIEKPKVGNMPLIDASAELRQLFDLNLSNGPVIGRTGGLFGLYRKASGLALVVQGIGPYQGDRVIAVRGTNGLADGLTDLNCGISTAHNGATIHAGFNRTFSEMKPALQKQLAPNLYGAGHGTIHCVGHSLGGALASIIAGWIKTHYKRPVNLYTFGAPRVGLNNYASKSTMEVERHFRCTHGADPVPKVPVWPFEHAPNSGGEREYRLDKGQLISPWAHRISRQTNGTPSYRDTVRGDSWQKLKIGSHVSSHRPIRLDYANRHQACFSDYWAGVIQEGLITLLKDSGHFASISAQATIGSQLTFFDTIAKTLHQVAKASEQFAEQTRGLLGHMLVFAGLAGVKVAELSYRFIRWVFERTLGALYRSVNLALKSLGGA